MSHKAKIAAAGAAFAVALSAVLITVSYISQRSNLIERYTHDTKALAATAAAMVDPDAVGRYMSTLETDSEYEHLYKHFKAIQRENDLAFLFSYVPSGDSLTVFVQGTSPGDEGHFELGGRLYLNEHYEPDLFAFMSDIFTDPQAQSVLISDNIYGHYITALHVVHDTKGQPALIIGADIAMEKINSELREYLFSICLLTGFIIVVSVLVYLFLINSAHRIAQREAERKIREAVAEKNALAHLNNVMNGLDEMIYVTDPATDKILFINENMKRHYGIEGDAVGKLCYKLLQKDRDSRCGFCPCYELEKEPGKVVVWEEHSDFTGRFYRNTDSYIEWPGGKIVHLQHSIDVTELREAKEMAEQSSRYKSAFLANMSHEIRTPMNAILGVTEILMRDGGNPPSTMAALGKIYESGNLLMEIINDILDLSKIEAGKLELIPVKYDIPSLINDTVQLNRLRYDSKPVEFTLSVCEDTPLYLNGDELRIKQILNNLISNAYKYTDAGKIGLSVSAEREGGGASDVTMVFSVSDTGQGMTDEQLNRLFDEYTRFNVNTNRAIIGTGLGMSITKRLVGLMDGVISVESEEGKGTTFTVRIPQRCVDEAVCGSELAEKLSQFRFQSTSINKKMGILREHMPYGRVLIVDDVESNLYVARGMMAPYGMVVETADSGFAAIEKIKQCNVYDVIFMDHMMPRMDGMEAVKIIREMGYASPIVALTANALVGQKQMFLDGGFDGYITKPIDSRELNAVLNKYVRRQRSDDDAQEDVPGAVTGADIDSEKRALEMHFTRDAERALNVLDGLRGRLENLSEEEANLYVVTVHGVKSALANIGEMRIRELALKLEKAGRAGDTAVMVQETGALIDALRGMVEKLKTADMADGSDIQINGDDTAFLREKLSAIKAACEEFDPGTASSALNELTRRRWPNDIAAALDGISVSLLHSAFEDAARAAEDAAKTV